MTRPHTPHTPVTGKQRGVSAQRGTPTMLTRSKYQIFPPHPSARREALKASIADRGVDKATVWDEQGNLLDGWEREFVCQELGVNCPREVRQFDNDAEKGLALGLTLG